MSLQYTGGSRLMYHKTVKHRHTMAEVTNKNSPYKPLAGAKKLS